MALIDSILGALHGAADSVAGAIRYGNNDQRNAQLKIAYQLTQQGIHPQHALPLSEILAYHPNNAQTQQAFTQALQHFGYLSHQAR